ncbi:MAG: YciI family protein [Vicinamibacteria bacterium]
MRKHLAVPFLSVALAASAAAQTPPTGPTPKPATALPPGMAKVYMVLLKKGPAWTAEKTEATTAIQAGHMANIARLWKEKKLIVAGPGGDDGDLRGVFVFDTDSLEEAKALAASDPAIKAGRLAPEFHSWWVERKALPVAGEYCQK